MNAVTDSQKRYRKGPRVFVCLGCYRLAESHRGHSITCSPRCRTWLHRNPARLQSLDATCAGMGIKPALTLECAAVGHLRPDLFDRIRAGELELAAVRADVHREFIKRVCEEVDKL